VYIMVGSGFNGHWVAGGFLCCTYVYFDLVQLIKHTKRAMSLSALNFCDSSLSKGGVGERCNVVWSGVIGLVVKVVPALLGIMCIAKWVICVPKDGWVGWDL